jgi:hypothetical protein
VTKARSSKDAAGCSGTPLAKKLGILEGRVVCVLQAPARYKELLKPVPAGVRFASAPGAAVDIVHVFVKARAILKRELASLLRVVKPDVAIWVSWPKKAAKVPTDITEDVVRAEALPLGLVDIKVCAVDETWSGLKLVIRKENRPSN